MSYGRNRLRIRQRSVNVYLALGFYLDYGRPTGTLPQMWLSIKIKRLSEYNGRDSLYLLQLWTGVGRMTYRNPENPGVRFCKDCNRILTQGSPSCIRCGKCARTRRESNALL